MFFDCYIFAITAVTVSLKFRTIFSPTATLTALSVGVELVRLGGVVSGARREPEMAKEKAPAMGSESGSELF